MAFKIDFLGIGAVRSGTTWLTECLRRPEDTVYSFYWWKKANFESGDLADTFEEELERDRRYVERGFYYKQLKKFYDAFPEENIKVVLFEDIKEDSQAVLEGLYRFLGVRADYVPSFLNKRVNKGAQARSRLLARVVAVVAGASRRLRINTEVRSLMSNNLLTRVYFKLTKKPFDYPPIREETRLRLKRLFRKDVEKLEKLIERDLSSWK